jgi:hypothetical protein
VKTDYQKESGIQVESHHFQRSLFSWRRAGYIGDHHVAAMLTDPYPNAYQYSCFFCLFCLKNTFRADKTSRSHGLGLRQLGSTARMAYEADGEINATAQRAKHGLACQTAIYSNRIVRRNIVVQGVRPEVMKRPNFPHAFINQRQQVAPSAAVLFVGGISLFRLLERIQPVAKFATEPQYRAKVLAGALLV